VLAASGALNRRSVSSASAAGELVTDVGPAACVPGCFDEQSADVAVADFVIEACRRFSPEECHLRRKTAHELAGSRRP
jgi:hypothetical protein